MTTSTYIPRKTIRLKKDTFMSTGHLGRGIDSKWMIVPSGTSVRYYVRSTLSGIYHTVEIMMDNLLYSTSIIK